MVRTVLSESPQLSVESQCFVVEGGPDLRLAVDRDRGEKYRSSPKEAGYNLSA